MPAIKLQTQIDSGMLSRNTAAKWSNLAYGTMNRLLTDGTLSPMQPLGTKEIRISALELLKSLIANQCPFPIELAKAAVNFASQYQQDHLTYTREILRTYGQVSLSERSQMPLVLDKEPKLFWDDKGDIVG